MKKLLYTTSALVGAAFLMEAVVPAKAEVNVSLRYRAALESRSFDDAAGKGDKDTDIAGTGDAAGKDRSTRLNSAKINIGFNASKDHPNGLTTGASIDMVSAANKWDYNNAFGYISGSFGKIDVGDTHDVGYRTLGYGTPGTANFGAVDPGFNPAGIAINTSATGNIGARASTISYWSPSFSGAQVGVSWTPQVTTIPRVTDEEDDGNVVAKNGDPAGVEGKKASFKTAIGDVEDSMAFAASYSGSFGGTGVSMGVAFEAADTATDKEANMEVADIKVVHTDGTTAVTTNANTAIPTVSQDPSAYAGYVSFDIDAFTVGGSYGVWESPAANAGETAESTAMALGASYSVDALTFGLGWAQAETETTHHNIRVGASTTSPGNTVIQGLPARKQTLEKEIMSFTVAYQVGDGATIDFVMEQGSFEKDDSPAANPHSAKTEVDRSGFGVGIDLKF
jgi:hypothetical protein